jgi:signal transduction histidine kinase
MSQPPVKILLVDDLRENLVALEALLRAPERELHLAQSGDAALSLLLEHEFALAILDVQMPSMNGFELAELMRGTERTRRIPIVFVTAAGREMNYAFRGYESGAVDFLYKPLDPHMVRSKVAVFEEIFRQRLALETAQAELQHAVSARDDFMSMVSHELRNPLNTLYLQTQLRRRMAAEGRVPEPQALLKMIEREEHQMRSMIRLLDDMLDVSRLRTGRLNIEPGPMDAADMVRQLVEAMREQARARGTQLYFSGPDSLTLTADAFRIEQVVTNLLTNALRYGGGSPVEVSVGVDTGMAQIAVRDHGPGIAPADQERIFQQFERADSTGAAAGLGLGLFIARQIVQAHGGTLAVSSVPGDGAEFVVRLPLPRGA